jgi:hypothetical protein
MTDGGRVWDSVVLGDVIMVNGVGGDVRIGVRRPAYRLTEVTGEPAELRTGRSPVTSASAVSARRAMSA